MIDDSDIGNVVRRGNRPEQENHLIQSVVAGAAITKCGRRMEPRDRDGNELVSVRTSTTVTCKRCL